MNLGSKGVALIKSFEKCRLTAYQDQVGIWTIGWGHTGPEVHDGLTWTQAQADMQFILDTRTFCTAVTMNTHIAVNQNEFDALVALCFNIGAANFRTSTLLRLLNAGDVTGATAQFAVWNKVTINGAAVVSNGLVTRRAAEAALFAEAV